MLAGADVPTAALVVLGVAIAVAATQNWWGLHADGAETPVWTTAITADEARDILREERFVRHLPEKYSRLVKEEEQLMRLLRQVHDLAGTGRVPFGREGSADAETASFRALHQDHRAQGKGDQRFENQEEGEHRRTGFRIRVRAGT